MSPVLSKAAALDLSFRELQFLSNECRNLIRDKLEIELHEINSENRNVDIDQEKIENRSSSDEDNTPPKKIRSLMADSDD